MMNTQTPESPAVILEGIPRIGYNVQMCPFPGALFACMEYLGDPCDYDYIMGVSGAAFRRLWNRDDGGNIDLSYFGDEPFRRSFRALGYDWHIVPPERDAMLQGIKESIARGVPAISFGIIGPPEAGIVAGYQGEGEQLFGWSYFQEGCDGYYEKADWFETMDKNAGKGLIVIGARHPTRPAPRELLAPSLAWAIDLACTPARPMLPNHVGGLAAYDAWAAALEVDADYPADDGQIMEIRTMVYGDQVTMLYERHSAANYLKQMAALAPEATEHLNAAAALYDETAALTDSLWPWKDYSYQGAARRALADPALRHQLAGSVGTARASEAQAVEHLERALEILS